MLSIRRYILIVLATYALVSIPELYGQIVQYNFLNFNSNNGLSQNSVYSIDQDSIGRLWIGTANDINIWDGHEFKMYSDIFKGTKYLKSKNIKKLTLYNNLCIVSNDFGIEIIDIVKDSILTRDEFKAYQTFDVNKNLLYILSDTIIETISLDNLKKINKVQLKNSFYTIFAFDDFLYLYNYDKPTIIDLNEKYKVYSLKNCRLKKVKYRKTFIPIIIHTKDFNNTLPAEISSKIHYLETQSIEDIRSFYLYNDKIWIAQENELYIYQTNPGRYLKIDKSEILPTFSRLFVYDFFTDYKDNLYIYTNINGFYIFSRDNNKFIHIKNPNSSLNMVKCIHLLSDSTIVTGLYGGGLIYYYTNGNYKNIILPGMDAIWDIEASFESPDNFYAISTSSLYYFENKKFKKILRNNPNINFLNITKGINNYFLAYSVTNKSGKKIIIERIDYNFRTLDKYETDLYILNVFQKDFHTLLCSSFDGVYTIDINTGTKRKFLSNRAQAIMRENELIYISTNEGLFILDDQLTIKEVITKKTHNISDNFIYATLIDLDGNIWISTNRGINVVNLKSKKTINYNLNDGLQANEFNTNAYYKNGNLLYFGGVNGINIINTENIYNNQLKPNIYYTNVLVDDEIELKNSIDSITLNYSNNTISLSVRHINFTSKEKSEYFHKLSPIESNFINTGNNNFIRYTNLPQGSYTLEFYVVNQYGEKSDIKKLFIKVLPPFWKTWWFYTLAILSILIMISGFIIYLYERNRQKILLRYEVQKNLENERMRISRELHDNLGAQLSYMISQIDLFTAKYFKILNDDDRLKLKKLEKVSKEAIQTIRETIWLLNSKKLSIEQFIDKTKQYVISIRELNESIEIEYYENVDYSIIIPPTLAINLFRIVQESITNSLKHSRGNRIKIYFETLNNKLKIQIIDDGVGFNLNTEFLDHYGLKNMKARADEINASIVIRSEKLNGTLVEIEIDLHQMQYAT
ncbi:sensor histidine kinase [Thermaurantimonas aggregans]|uniref:sensor histidine kinase n=1 Tax=Thermaurantimonas aggregans TaxID=2173829 RepID=UPI0023F32A93|nr:histidine kinase [Thermaurantimonas aggregans]MCX8149662.1 histidine kinase [Thermaurantimonas aggregans]